MQELLSSELSTLQSKMGALDGPDKGELIKQDLNQAIERLNSEISGPSKK
jgi:hypothetical protein